MVNLHNFAYDVMHLRFFSEFSKRGLIVTKGVRHIEVTFQTNGIKEKIEIFTYSSNQNPHF